MRYILIAGLALVTALSGFDRSEYGLFIDANRDLSSGTLLDRHRPGSPYYSHIVDSGFISSHAFLDSITAKYGLTAGELALLEKNRFVVTERLGRFCFGQALHDIYAKDLPVFVTTDAVLHALHMSYDKILMDIEAHILKKKLKTALTGLYSGFPGLITLYGGNPVMLNALADADVYITMALSLLEELKRPSQFNQDSVINVLWNAVKAEQFVSLPLFSERPRKLDFSQFTVRGHYTRFYYDYDENKSMTLAPYFQAMMWLGRMDFLLTPPPAADEPPWTREEIRRMNLGATLLNELMDRASVRPVLDEMDRILTFLVGEPDNLTPAELALITANLGITGADRLLNDTLYDSFLSSLSRDPASGQRILSDIFIMDPFSSTPDPLPVSFRLLGQRFIIDSYIFSNVVYDRIVFNGQKIWRPMPDPLDAMFVLGNNDALPLLKSELDQYHYSSQLACLRYLVDAYDSAFWEQSLYNVWLNGIRDLNPVEGRTGGPLFMNTTAWHQEKLNTQLSSWAQLRHDNLLYAKQSYTGGTSCSYPHTYVEPYPELYRRIGAFADKAKAFFTDTAYLYIRLPSYLSNLKAVMDSLALLSEKELSGTPFSDADTAFLKRMLFEQGMSGAPPFSGWYSWLFYDINDANLADYIVADVHTQPTDEFGALVGRVLHVGLGKVNLGVFLAESPSAGFAPMAYVGPVFSYYEKITGNFERLTDEKWADSVDTCNLPARPDWVNTYLASADGNALPAGRVLDGVPYQIGAEKNVMKNARALFGLSQNSPNPFNPATVITYALPGVSRVRITVYDSRGRLVQALVDKEQSSGRHTVKWLPEGLNSGIYYIKMEAGAHKDVKKAVFIK